MIVDRDRFLILTALLATGVGVAPACNTAQAAPPDDPGRMSPMPPLIAATVVNVPPAPPTAPIAITDEPAPPEPLRGPTEEASRSAPRSKRPNPYDGTPVVAQSCDPALNAVGGPQSCVLKAPGPVCESFGDTKKECPTLGRLLKPRVATAANECLRRRSGTAEICEFNVTGICAYEALASACLVPAAKSICNKVVARCGPPHGHYNKMTEESCEAGVSGVADAQRAKFIACISESCRFETCLFL